MFSLLVKGLIFTTLVLLVTNNDRLHLWKNNQLWVFQNKSHIKKEKNCIRCCCIRVIIIVTLQNIFSVLDFSIYFFHIIETMPYWYSLYWPLEQCKTVYERLLRQAIINVFDDSQKSEGHPLCCINKNVNNSLYTVILNLSLWYEFISHKNILPSVCRPYASMEVLLKQRLLDSCQF